MKHTLGILLLVLLVSYLKSPNYRTGQSAELIIVKNDTLFLHNLPLEPLRDRNPILDSLVDSHTNDWGCSSTANWRGYVGIWEIKNDSLFFNDFYNCARKSKTGFPRDIIPPFAFWVSDTLRAQQGKQIYYQHSGWDRIYEKEHLLITKRGKIISYETLVNGFSTEDQGLYHAELLPLLLDNISHSIPDQFKGQEVFLIFSFDKKFIPFLRGSNPELIEFLQSQIDKLPDSKLFRNHEHYPFLSQMMQIELGDNLSNVYKDKIEQLRYPFSDQ